MSSWTLLLALSGAHCDLVRGELRFDPVLIDPDQTVFKTFWSTGKGWGTYAQTKDSATGDWQPEIAVLGGDLSGVKVYACGKTLEG
jgi:hypothetical protein